MHNTIGIATFLCFALYPEHFLLHLQYWGSNVGPYTRRITHSTTENYLPSAINVSLYFTQKSVVLHLACQSVSTLSIFYEVSDKLGLFVLL